MSAVSLFTSDFGNLPVPLHLGKDRYFFIILGKYTQNLGKIGPFFLFGMPSVTGGKTGQIKSLMYESCWGRKVPQPFSSHCFGQWRNMKDALIVVL